MLPWVSIFERIDEVLAPIHRLVVQSLPSIHKIAGRLEYLENRFPADVQEVLTQCGYPPSPRLSLTEYQDVLLSFKAKGAEAASQLLKTAYRGLLADSQVCREMLVDWEANPLLAKRLPILREALEATAEKRYNLAIPVFIANLEGLMADSRKESGYMASNKYKSLMGELAGTDKFFGPSMEGFVSSVLLVQFCHGDPLPDLSRHAILHGGDTEYGTEENAVRVVALFDYVQELLTSRGRSE